MLAEMKEWMAKSLETGISRSPIPIQPRLAGTEMCHCRMGGFKAPPCM